MVEAYLEWGKRRGIQFPKLQYPHLFPPGFLGSVANDTIQAGQKIVTVPNQSLFSYLKAINSDLRVLIQEQDTFFRSNQSMYQDMILVTFLVYQKFKGQNSQWFDFLQAQPQDVQVLQDWLQQELDQLQDRDLANTAKQQKEINLDVYKNWKMTMVRRRDFFTQEMVEKKHYFWAWRLLMTRAFGSFIPSVCLAPIAEFLNHSNTQTYFSYLKIEQEVEIEPKYVGKQLYQDYDEAWMDQTPFLMNVYTKVIKLHKERGFQDNMIKNILYSLYLEAESIQREELNYFTQKYQEDNYSPQVRQDIDFHFAIVAGETIQAGQQIFLNYGRYSNKQLLISYGFASSENAYNYARVKIHLSQLTKKAGYQRNIQSLGFTDPCVFKIKAQFLCKELIKVIRALNWLPQYTRDACFSPVNFILQQQSFRIFIEVLYSKLEEFPTSVEQDQKILESRPPIKESFAVVYRLEVKKILFSQIKIGEQILEILEKLIEGQPFPEEVSESIEKYMEILKLYNQ